MSFLFFFCIIFPIAIAIFAKVFLKATISYGEMIAIAIISISISAIIWFGGRFSNATDYEVWNGEVTRTNAEQRYCPSGWVSSQDSFCTEYRTRQVKTGEICTPIYNDKGTKTGESCTPIYTTEYNYYYDWERRYFVFTNISYNYEIPRIDRQGVKYPPLFVETNVGDPASRLNSYSNWLRAASESIFFEDGNVEEKYKDIIPAYPLKIYDYRKINRVITIGNVHIPNRINGKISELLKTLGPQKQMNLVLVAVDADIASDDFPFAVRKAWYGFKKNDAVIFLGLKDNKLVWSNVLSWSKASIFDITVRDSINSLFLGKPVDYDQLISNLQIQGMLYERRSMKEFEYLKSEIPIPTWVIVSMLFVTFVGTGGSVWFFHKNDFKKF